MAKTGAPDSIFLNFRLAEIETRCAYLIATKREARLGGLEPPTLSSEG